MTSHQIRDFQSPVNLPGYVCFAPLAAWKRVFGAALVLGIVTGGTNEQVALKRRAGGIPHHLCPLHLIRLVVGVIEAVCVCASVIVANLRRVGIVVNVQGRVNKSGASDKDVHLKTSNGGDVQHDSILPSYSASTIPNLQLFSNFDAIRARLFGEGVDAGSEDYPVATHFTGMNAALTAELKHPFYAHSKRFGGVFRRANQVKCGLCHAKQHTGEVAA